MAYERIEDHGVIGNMRTVALVTVRGAIDWYCFPRFDSPSVFAALLDDEKGGSFSIRPLEGQVIHKQLYWPETNVLLTRFLSPDGVGEIEDFMPVGPAAQAAHCQDEIVRRVKVVRGSLTFEVICEPAFDYARTRPRVTIQKNGAVFEGAGLTLALSSQVSLHATERGAAARFVLSEGETTTFVLHPLAEGCEAPPTEEQANQLFEDTVRFWRGWVSRCTSTSTARPSRMICGPTCGGCSTGYPRTGTARTRASGRRGAAGATSSTRR